jgi:hypothetical protein
MFTPHLQTELSHFRHSQFLIAESIMTPDQVAMFLRSIVERIDCSRHPSKMLVAAELKHVLGALDNDARMDTERKQELEKKNKEMLDKMQDDLDRKFEDVVKKGVSGDDVTKAVGKLEKDLDDIQRRTQIR